MSSSDQRSGEPQSIASMRVRLKYADVETFIERFGANVTRNGIFIATKSVKPPGTLVRFELQLSDGTKLLKGEGVVAWKRESDSPEAQVPGRPPGMGLRFSKLDADSRKLLERIAAFKAEHGEADGGGVPNAPLGGAESGPVMALGIDSGPVSALERTPLPERIPAPAAAGSSPSLTAMPMPTTYEPGGDTDMRSLEELRALIDEDEGAFDEVLERARRIAKDTHNGAAAGDDDTLKALDELLQSRGDPGADATVESATQALAGLLGAKAPARVHQRGPHAWAEPAPPRAPVAAPPVAAEPVAAEPPAAAEPAIMTSALPAPAIVPEAAPFDELPPAATSSPATRRPLTSPSAGASTRRRRTTPPPPPPRKSTPPPIADEVTREVDLAAIAQIDAALHPSRATTRVPEGEGDEDAELRSFAAPARVAPPMVLRDIAAPDEPTGLEIPLPEGTGETVVGAAAHLGGFALEPSELDALAPGRRTVVAPVDDEVGVAEPADDDDDGMPIDDGALLELDPDEGFEEAEPVTTGRPVDKRVHMSPSPRRDEAPFDDLNAALDAALDLRLDSDGDVYASAARVSAGPDVPTAPEADLPPDEDEGEDVDVGLDLDELASAAVSASGVHRPVPDEPGDPVDDEPAREPASTTSPPPFGSESTGVGEDGLPRKKGFFSKIFKK